MSNPYQGMTSSSRHGSASNSPHDDSDEHRIGRHITPQPDGCWLYTGATAENYTVVLAHGEAVALHRWVYETLVGPIDRGRHLHHKCETKGCCNPEHLVPLTPSEHSAEHARLRAESPPQVA